VLLAGCSDHLEDLDRQYTLAEDVSVSAITSCGGVPYVLLDGDRVARVDVFDVAPIAHLQGDRRGQSMASYGDGLLVGIEQAGLVKVDPHTGDVAAVDSFDDLDGRDTWENPAGPTPDLRSVAVSATGSWFAGVHVGGLWRSSDSGRSWTNVIPPDDDVHEVSAGEDGHLAVAAARGFGWSSDDGATWQWTVEGLHAAYCRAVALGPGTAYVSASTGPRTDDGRVYRAELGGTFEPCPAPVPESFPFNLDTGCLAARAGDAAIGAADGRIWRSSDGGTSFDQITERVGRVRVLRFV
jgi:hypothetical protein